jgi:hypothetical protein
MCLSRKKLLFKADPVTIQFAILVGVTLLVRRQPRNGRFGSQSFLPPQHEVTTSNYS